MFEKVQSQSLLTPNQLLEAMQDSDSEISENQEEPGNGNRTRSRTNSQNSVVSVDYVFKNPTRTQMVQDPQIKVENVVANNCEEENSEENIPNSQNSIVSVDYVLNPTLVKVEKGNNIKIEKNRGENHEENFGEVYDIFECQKCGREFENEVELIHHIDVKDLFTLLMNSGSVHEGGKTKGEKTGGQAVLQSDHSLECENCNQLFTTKSKLNFHNCQQNIRESQKTVGNISSSQISQQQPKFLCDICEEPFGFSFLLRDHVKSTHDY